MNENYLGTMSMGIKAPILKEGDPIIDIVVNSVLNATNNQLQDKDVIGITESLVARSLGEYVTINDIVNWIQIYMGFEKTITVVNPIYSRNRFAMILKAIARAAKDVIIYMPDVDEVGNVRENHPFTGLDYCKYYKQIVNDEGTFCKIIKKDGRKLISGGDKTDVIYCGLHDYEQYKNVYITLSDICNDKCDFGLLGSNKSSEEKLKLFPSSKLSQDFVEEVQKRLNDITGVNVEVMIYGDGCFKDPIGGIWEFADPVVSPGFTKGLNGTPNEIKIKAFADDKYDNLNGDKLTDAIINEIQNKQSDLKGNMNSQGTTPRRYVDLLGSLMDLTSGSGDKGTPIVLVRNYFKNFSNF